MDRLRPHFRLLHFPCLMLHNRSLVPGYWGVLLWLMVTRARPLVSRKVIHDHGTRKVLRNTWPPVVRVTGTTLVPARSAKDFSENENQSQQKPKHFHSQRTSASPKAWRHRKIDPGKLLFFFFLLFCLF